VATEKRSEGGREEDGTNRWRLGFRRGVSASCNPGDTVAPGAPGGDDKVLLTMASV
jgi:hypothetical protein